MKYEEFNLSKNADGLLPVVVQDCETLKVLMVAYMNEEAYNKTCETGKATFYSRTREQLWTKGETSGNFIEVVNMYPDCDNDPASDGPPGRADMPQRYRKLLRYT